MNHPTRMSHVHRCVSIMLVGLLLTIAPGVRVFAQDAPPNDTAAPPAESGPPGPFNWHDIPVNQTIPIQRASFDAGGYQLVDGQGQTIVVPFVNNSLYVMKFAQSTNGTMYFVNDGVAPILYVPQGAGLRNLTVEGAFWYPPAQAAPVFYGIAPTWDAYVAMGWYPGMRYVGGYWVNGGVYIATPGLYVEIGGTRVVGWVSYARYYRLHPGWSPVAYLNRAAYVRDHTRVYPASREGRGKYNIPHPQGALPRANEESPIQNKSATNTGTNTRPSTDQGNSGQFKLPGGGRTATTGNTQRPTSNPDTGTGTGPVYKPPNYPGPGTGTGGAPHGPTNNSGPGTAAGRNIQQSPSKSKGGSAQQPAKSTDSSKGSSGFDKTKKP